jgi:alpha-tubulin suppressor-like RCC1 family protein
MYHSVAVSSKGSVYTWGKNDLGQLGDATNVDRSTPTKITVNLANYIITAISAGAENSLALASDGYVYSWGRYFIFNDLGIYTQINIPLYTFCPSKINAISAGLYHNVALSISGEVYTWATICMVN